MKSRIVLCGCLVLLTSTLTAAEPGLLKSEFIYETAPFPQCHASTLVETSGGLVAAWFGGTHEKHPDVGIWVSRQVDGRWTAPVEVVNGVQSDGTRYPCWNPVLFQPKSGPLMLFYKVGPSPSTWWGMLTTSTDSGKTWGMSRRLPDGILGPIKNKPIQLASGDILCPTSSESTTKPSRWQVHFERSSDGGQTWTATPPLNDGVELSAIQPSILQLGGDKLLALGRTRQGKVFQIASNDLGKTWGTMSLTELPNPNSGTDAVTLRDGRHLLIYNHTAKGRSPLNLALSNDGVKWHSALALENEPGEYSYPAIIQTADGLVHVTYTWKRQKVRHAIVDPTKLALRPIVDGKWAAAGGDEPYDVVIIGGTPGGIATAVTAARLGRKVLLVEYHRHLGAMSTSGLGASDIENRAMIQGFFREFVDRVKEYYVHLYGKDSQNVKLCRDGYWYEPSVAEKIFESFIAEQPSITVWKHHELTKTERQGARLVGVTIKNRATGESRDVHGKLYIDATYEGDVYALAGAEYRVGRESRSEFGEPHAGHIYVDPKSKQTLGGTGEGDDRLPAFTFRLCLTSDPKNQVPMLSPPPGYDRAKYVGYFYDLTNGRFGDNPNLTTVAYTLRQLPNHKIDVNMKPTPLGFVFVEENKGYADANWSKREKITEQLRNLHLGLLWFLQHDEEVSPKSRELALTYHPCRDEFADNNHFPFQLYVREARRLVGEFTLSEKNISEQPGLISERTHADVIAVGEFPIDSFPIRKRQPSDTVVLEGYLGMLGSITRPYQIPYRIMIPRHLDGLIVPVAASTTHVAFSSIRLEPTWMAMGQAAGVAAHLAVERGVEPRAVPIGEVQAILRKQGAVLEFPK